MPTRRRPLGPPPEAPARASRRAPRPKTPLDLGIDLRPYFVRSGTRHEALPPAPSRPPRQRRIRPGSQTQTRRNPRHTHCKTFVQVYVEENFKGRAVRLEVPCALENDARLREVGIQNDSIQSLKIPDGVTITLYAAAGFGGESASFTGKAATLGKLKGQTSSLKAEVK